MWYIAWLFVVEAVAITAANAATIVIFTRTPRLHNKQYILIISQAVADLFVGLLSVPMLIVIMVNDFVNYSTIFSRAFYIQDNFFGAASLFGLAALSIERAHATFFPFRHSTLGKGPYIVGIALMWILPAIVVSPLLLSMEYSLAAYVKIVVIGLVFVIIYAAYSLIVFKVRFTTSQAHDVNTEENKKLTVTLAVVTILSLVMWLPYQCLAIYYLISLENSRNISPSVYYSIKFLQFGNSFINSVFYAFRMREMKREIYRVILCCRKIHISVNDETFETALKQI